MRRYAPIGAALALLPFMAMPAASQSSTASLARATIDAFISTCGVVVVDPEAAVSDAAGNSGLVHASSEDGRLLTLAFPMTGSTETTSGIFVSYEIAAVAPGAWIVTCNAASWYTGATEDLTSLAFEQAVDEMPGLQRVGGAVQRLSLQQYEVDDVGIAPALYVVTGWSKSDPLLHMWAELGDFGFDLWVQHSVRKP